MPGKTIPAAVHSSALASGNSQVYIGASDGTIYAFECHATAPGAVSTSIDSCSLNSYGASPSTSSGPVASTSAAIAVPVTTYRVCWTASARYSDGTSQSTSGCTISSSVGGAGAG